MEMFAYIHARRHLKELETLITKGQFLLDCGRIADAMRCYYKARIARVEIFDYLLHHFGRSTADKWGFMSAKLLNPLGKRVRA